MLRIPWKSCITFWADRQTNQQKQTKTKSLSTVAYHSVNNKHAYIQLAQRCELDRTRTFYNVFDSHSY